MTTAVDSSGNGLNGTYQGEGTNTTLNAMTLTGPAPRFHTTNDAVDQGVVVTTPNLDLSNKWAFRFKMLPEMNNDFTGTSTQEECIFEYGVDLYVHHRTLDLQLKAKAVIAGTPHILTWAHDGSLTDGAVHDVVFQYTGLALELWVDSALVSSTGAAGVTTPVGAVDLRLSQGASSSAGNWFDGVLDEFTFYANSLTLQPVSPPPPPPPPTPGPVPLIKGLLTRGTPSSLPQVTGYCPEIHWKDLQTTQNGPITAAGQANIEAILAGSHPARFRLFAGYLAPAWLKTLVGTVTIYYAQNPSDPPENVVKFWDYRVSVAKADLLTKLAALYDGQIKVFFDCGPSVVYSEPFLVQAAYAPNRTALLAAGYTVAQHKANIQSDIDAMGAFTQTNLALAFNGLSYVKPDGTAGIDLQFTYDMMDRMRTNYGSRAILQNNSLRNSFFKQALYTSLKTRGAPLSIQTSTLNATGMTDLAAVLDYCVNMGCHAVELPSGFANVLSKAQLTYYNNALAAN